MSDAVGRWAALSHEVFTGIADWRAAHPRATCTEIEDALDERLARLRAQMLQDTALASPATTWADQPADEQPRCPDCDQPLQARGAQTRHLQTTGGQEVTLTRTYATCPACGTGLFPPG